MLTSRRRFLQKASTLISLSAVSIFFSSSLTSAKTPLTHLKNAKIMLEKLRLHPTNNAYIRRSSTKPQEFTWGGDRADDYVSETDCSGFLNELLSHSYGINKDFFKKWMGTKRPRAKDYHEVIYKQNKFKLITNINKVKAGDIIAIKYQNVKNNPNTGHVLIVAESLSQFEETQDEIKWKVPIIDQSGSGHGEEDTRYKNDGSDPCKKDNFHNGLGKGFLRISTNKKGEIIGYSWSLCESSDFHINDSNVLNDYDLKKEGKHKEKDERRHLVIGRLNPRFFN